MSNLAYDVDGEQLIKAVQKRSPIYDKSNPSHSNRAYIASLWKDVAKEINCSDLKARKRWSHIRDYFLKMYRERSLRETDSGTRRKWYLYDKLSFLVPYVGEKRLADFTKEEDCYEGEVDDNASHVSSASVSYSYTENAEALETELSQEVSIADLPPASRKRKGSLTDIYWEILKTIQKFDRNHDEDELFLRSLVPKMKMLNTYQKLECQSEMTMLVYKHIKLSEKAVDGDSVRQSDRESVNNNKTITGLTEV